MGQTFKTEEDYVRYSLRDFRPNRREENCETTHREGERPSIGAWLIDEGSFQEYSYTCQECYDNFLEAVKVFFHNPETEMDLFICEDCNVDHQRFMKGEDGSLTDNLYVYRDVEDKSLTDVCLACYQIRKEKDRKFWDDY